MKNDDGKLVLEDARLIFRNFTGKEGMYNQEGQRNFCVILDHEMAEDMVRDGWNIKYLRPREEDEQPTPYVQVSVGFKFKPPRMVLITSRGRLSLNEDECEIFDWVDIKKVDLIVRPYHWSVRDDKGVKAYLQSMYLTMEEDYLDQKYSEVPEVERGSSPLELNRGSEEHDESNNIVDAEIVEE